MRFFLLPFLAGIGLAACGGSVDSSSSGSPSPVPSPSPTKNPPSPPPPPSPSPPPPPATQTVASFKDLINAVAMDPNNLYVALQQGGIVRVPKDGAAVTPLAATGPNTEGLAVDNVYAYFTSLDTNAVARVNLEGGVAETLAVGQARPWGITADATNLYWANQGDDSAGGSGNSGSIMSLPKSGGTPALLASGEQTPANIATDGGALYWLDGPWGSANAAVRKLFLGPDAAAESLASELDNVDSLVVSAGQALWTNDGAIGNVAGSVMSAPVSGGATSTLYSKVNGPVAIAADAANVYFGAQDASEAGAVLRIPLGGGASSEVMPAPPAVAGSIVGISVMFLLVDDAHVFAFDYWVEEDGMRGRIRVAAK